MEVLATETSQGNELKSIQIINKEVKVSLFVDDMIQYLGNPKNSTKKLLKFGKTAKYKINILKNCEISLHKYWSIKTEIKRTISLIIASKSINYLEINLTKEVIGFVHWKV